MPRRTVLCLSRAYLAHLLPEVGRRRPECDWHHIVQTDAEAQVVARLGGTVVLNIQDVVRRALAGGGAAGADWHEPADFRQVTGFSWSPLHADRWLPSFAPERRARIAGALHAAIGRLFETHQYAAFVSEPVALFVTQLLLYQCRRHGTRPLLWANTYFPNAFYFADAMEISTPVRRATSLSWPPPALREDVAAYAAGVARDQAGPVYHHAFSGRRATRFGYFKQRRGGAALVLRPGWASRAIQAARWLRAVLKRATLRWNGDFMTAGAAAEHWFYFRCLWTPTRVYDRLPDAPSADAVVFPLQYEPEASLLYFAPDIVSQVSFVETLLRALPSGKVLWVKEHPNQFGALGLPAWRALKTRYDNVRFIYGRESGRTLIRRAGLVVTISSSMGMDALLLGRRVLVAGRVFYRRFTGAVAVDSYQDLAARVADPAMYAPTDSFEANVDELTTLGLAAYPGDPQPAHSLFDETNLERLGAAILAEMDAEGAR